MNIGAYTRLTWMAAFLFAIPFSYALQVFFRNYIIGVIPYFLLLPLILRVALELTKKRVQLIHGVDIYSVTVGALLLLSSIHIAASFLQGVDLWHSLRNLVIYNFSLLVFFYFRSYVSVTEARMCMAAVAIASLIIGAHWLFDTYQKIVLREISYFTELSYEYVKNRNNLSDDQVNVSMLRPEYRSYGLMDKHTMTGAAVLVGGLALLAYWGSSNLRYLAFVVYFVLLSVGMATTAWLSFVLVAPFVLFLAGDKKMAETMLTSYGVMIFGLFAILASLTIASPQLYGKIIEIGAAQISHVGNLSNPDSTSYYSIYKAYFLAFTDFLANNPMAFYFGEGFPPQTAWQRGGDVGFFELLATYGIPVVGLLFVTIGLAFKNIFSRAFAPDVTPEERGILAFAFGVLSMFVISQVHYNTFFNKAFFVLIPMALGLVSRFSPKVTQEMHVQSK